MVSAPVGFPPSGSFPSPRPTAGGARGARAGGRRGGSLCLSIKTIVPCGRSVWLWCSLPRGTGLPETPPGRDTGGGTWGGSTESRRQAGRMSERGHPDLGGEPRGDAIAGKAAVSRWGGRGGQLCPIRHAQHPTRPLGAPKALRAALVPGGTTLQGMLTERQMRVPWDGAMERCQVRVGNRVPLGKAAHGRRCNSPSVPAEDTSRFSGLLSCFFADAQNVFRWIWSSASTAGSGAPASSSRPARFCRIASRL